MSGPQCCENPPTLGSSTGENGRIEEIGGLKSYTTGSLDSKLAIVFIADIFGYEAPKLRQIADKVAAAGFYVVVPDFFYGDPYLPEKPLASWLPNHQVDKDSEDARKVVADLKSKGASAVGVAGFCWGGMVISKMSPYGEFEAAVILHPGPLSEDDIKGDFLISYIIQLFYHYKQSHVSRLDIIFSEAKVPTAFLGAEFDEHAPPEQLKKFGELLSAKSVENIVKIYPGVTHGWSTRYKDDDEHVVKQAMEAHSDMLNWLTKYLK